MASNYYSKKLIVEGDQDKRVIPELIEANLNWEWVASKMQSLRHGFATNTQFKCMTASP